MNHFDDAASEERSDKPERSSDHNPQTSQKTYPALSLNVELYQDYLDDPSLSDEDKNELITALWSIVVSFVDLGFSIHPLQQSGACGQNDPVEQIAKVAKASSAINSSPCENQDNGYHPPAGREPR